jgi:hypothetical protein
MLLYEIVGRCPTPCPPFEKGGAKTFLSASPGIDRSKVVKIFRKALAFRFESLGQAFLKACGGLEAEPPRSLRGGGA